MPSPNQFEIDSADIMSEVYSYPFPEVRQLLTDFHVPEELMLNTVPRTVAQSLIEQCEFEPALELPEYPNGALNLDEVHEPVLERITNRNSERLPGLDGFKHRYPGHGSSNFMFVLMAEWKAQGKMERLGVLKDEYDGYSAYARNLDIPIDVYDSLGDAEPDDARVWFTSNPSATDGNWLPNDEWEAFVEAGHRIVYDAAYVDLTEHGGVDVSAPNIEAVLTSPSKIFGVFRHRETGVAYTREEVGSLYGNKWFKDVPALLQTLKLYESFEPHELPHTYREVKHSLVRQLGIQLEEEVVARDVLLLAGIDNPSDSFRTEHGRLVRSDRARLGLTKLFERFEEHHRPAGTIYLPFDQQ